MPPKTASAKPILNIDTLTLDEAEQALTEQINAMERDNLTTITDIRKATTDVLYKEVADHYKYKTGYLKMVTLAKKVKNDRKEKIDKELKDENEKLAKKFEAENKKYTDQFLLTTEQNTQINSLTEQLASEKQDCEGKITRATDGLKAELSAEKAKLREELKINEQKDADIEKLRKEIEDIRSKNAELTTELSEAKTTIDSKDDECYNLNMKNIESDNATMVQEEETSALKIERDTLTKNIAALGLENQDIKKNLTSKTNELDEALKDIESKKAENAILVTQINDLKTKVSENEKEVTRLTGLLNMSNIAKDRIQEELDTIKKKISANDSALQQDLDKKIQELEEEKAKLAEALSQIDEQKKIIADLTRDTEEQIQAIQQELEQRLKQQLEKANEELAVKEKALTDATADQTAEIEKCKSDLIESQLLQQQQLNKLFNLEDKVNTLLPEIEKLSQEVTEITRELLQEHTKNKENQLALTTQIATLGEEKTSLEAQIIKKDEEIKKLKPSEANEELVKIIQKYMEKNKITDDGDSEKRTMFLDSLKKKIDNKKQGGSLNNSELYANLKNSLASKSLAEQNIILDYIQQKMRNIK
jgi:chromosome segregation ATPase